METKSTRTTGKITFIKPYVRVVSATCVVSDNVHAFPMEGHYKFAWKGGLKSEAAIFEKEVGS